MLQRATLGGVPGVVDLRFQLQRGLDGEWRGTFFFQADDEQSVARLIGDRPALLETTLEEARRTLPVTVTSCARSGCASFRSGERSVPVDGPNPAASSKHTPH